jgi:Domain of unknown function (DUF4112)
MDARVDRYVDPEIEAALARVEALARVMDSMFEIPGTKVRIGFDAMLGLVPVLGDLLSQAISSYIIWEARRLGVSRFTMARMIGNSAIDTVVGIVPFVGDAFDVVFRANMKNLALLRAHLEKNGHVSRKAGGNPGPVIDIPSRRVG